MYYEDKSLLPQVYSVSEINEYIREIFDMDDVLQDVQIEGEISAFTRAQSGHAYFTLKDNNSQINCIMFRNHFQFAGRFQQGDKIVARGAFNVYVPHGKYQFYVTSIRAAGTGNIYQRFLQLKAKLEQEGLFEQERKRVLPYFPQKIGIATSAQGAVIHDIIRTLTRKCPHVEIVLLPTMVQGDTAPPDICESLRILQEIPGIEVIILARGGGSFEDLDCFNSENVARAIFSSKIPVISAVGHETDYTISDFVADYRAPTPTAAAEMVVPDAFDIKSYLMENFQSWKKNLNRNIRDHQQFLDEEQKSQVLCIRKSVSVRKREASNVLSRFSSIPVQKKLLTIQQKMESMLLQNTGNKRVVLDLLQQKLELMDIGRTLQRGFSITMLNGKILKSTEKVVEGEDTTSVLADGKIISLVKNTEI
jgi:exodeoxyribonuclease VII large subunit